VLLVAGGVGATFALPIFRDLGARRGGRGVRMVWAVRREEEARGVLEKGEGVEVFLTGGEKAEGTLVTGQGLKRMEDRGIELEERARLLTGTEEGTPERDSVTLNPRETINLQRGRPDLSTIVDAIFKSAEDGKIAILVCGPAGMGRSLRMEVGRWVEQGRDVFWHNEAFRW